MLNPELLQRGLATLNAIDGAQGEAVMTGLPTSPLTSANTSSASPSARSTTVRRLTCASAN